VKRKRNVTHAGRRGKAASNGHDQKWQNNFPAEFLCQAHYGFMLGYVELMRQKEAAIIDAFFERQKLSSLG
jgi:hypothetical protein